MSELSADVLLAHDSADRESVGSLAGAFERAGLRVLSADVADLGSASWDSLAPLIGPVRAVVLAVGRMGPPDIMRALVRMARAAPDGVARPTYVALLPGADRGAAEKVGVDDNHALDLRSGELDGEMLGRFIGMIGGEPPGSASPPPPPPDSVAQAEVRPQPEPPRRKTAPSKVAPPPEPAPPRDAFIADIWDDLDDAARSAVAQADAIARRRGASEIHVEDLLIGLYREPGGPTAAVLHAAGVSDRVLAGIVADQLPSIRPGTPLKRVPQLPSAPSMSGHVLATMVAASDVAKGAGVPAIRTRDLLLALVTLEDCSVSEGLRAARVTPEAVASWQPIAATPTASAALTAALAGFRSDSTDGPDLLDIGREVDAIATVLAARTVEPPLALGLFGDWGTGKTFFMDHLERRIDELARAEAAADRRGDDRVYCRNIVQLRFNAGHYIDQDLWASLADGILEGLDDALSTVELPEEAVEDRGKERAGLLLERAQAGRRLDDARAVETEARQRAAEAQDRVERIDGLYDELVDAIRPEAILAGAARVAVAQPEVSDQIAEQSRHIQEKVDAAAKELNVKPETLRNELSGSSDGGYLAAWRAVLHDRGSRVWLPIAAVGILAVVAAVALDLAGFESAVPGATLLSLLVGVAAGLRPLLQAGRIVSRVMVDARAEGRRLVEAKRAEVREAALEVKRTSEEAARQAGETVHQAEDDLRAVDERLARLRPGREMADFVKARQSSSDYRSRLGVVARARDDFEELSRLLARDLADEGPDDGTVQAEEDVVPAVRPIERIILYIDDLDRCKEKEVVAVLQAVHLLLAFRLFVVVVAVDPRWLLHSLRVQSQVLGTEQQGVSEEDEDAIGWEATPLNYLEKIFQIPFALRPMGRTGFGAIIDNLVGHAEEGAADGATGGAGRTDGATHPGARTDAGRLDAPDGRDGKPPAADVPSPRPAADAKAPPPAATHLPAIELERRPVEMNPRALGISDDERTSMARMYPLIGTPRGAKRFVNVYRLLKASHPVERQGEFAAPAVHRPVLLLLAALTGFPREAAEILRTLIDDEPDGEWWAFVIPFAESEAKAAEQTDRLRAARWEQFAAKLRQVRSGDELDLSCADVRAWALSVARYSFESSRVLFMEAAEA